MSVFIPIGLILGCKKVIVAFLLAVLFGGIYGIIVILIDRKNKSKLIPFAPFISIATIIAIFYGYDIVTWYISHLV